MNLYKIQFFEADFLVQQSQIREQYQHANQTGFSFSQGYRIFGSSCIMIYKSFARKRTREITMLNVQVAEYNQFRWFKQSQNLIIPSFFLLFKPSHYHDDDEGNHLNPMKYFYF